jgi:hypothetical protein
VLDYMTVQLNGSENCDCQGGCLHVLRASVPREPTSAGVDIDHE